MEFIVFLDFISYKKCLTKIILNSFLLWALKLFKLLNLSAETHVLLADEKADVDGLKRPWEIINAGHKIGTPRPLFKELVYVVQSVN